MSLKIRTWFLITENDKKNQVEVLRAPDTPWGGVSIRLELKVMIGKNNNVPCFYPQMTYPSISQFCPLAKSHKRIGLCKYAWILDYSPFSPYGSTDTIILSKIFQFLIFQY
jgi:hypothetical protein